MRDENGYLTRYTLDGQGHTVQVEEFSQGYLWSLVPINPAKPSDILGPPLTPDATTRYAYRRQRQSRDPD